MAKEWWTDAQVAEYLGIKEESVRSWISRRGLTIERQMMSSAADVKAAKRVMPGRGGDRRSRSWTEKARPGSGNKEAS